MRTRNITKQTIWVIAFLLALPLALSSAETIKPHVSLFDWNKDGVKDTLIFFDNKYYEENKVSEQLSFNDLSIHMSNGKTFLLSNVTQNGTSGIFSLSQAYGKFDSFLKRNRAHKEEYFFILSLYQNQDYPSIFFQTTDFQDPEAPLTLMVLGLDSSGIPKLIFENKDYSLNNILDMDNDNILEIVGYPCIGQYYDIYIASYYPSHVYSYTGGRFILNEYLSEKLNLQEFDGWAGLECTDEWVVLEHPKLKKPKVMKLEDAIKLEKKLNKGRKVEEEGEE